MSIGSYLGSATASATTEMRNRVDALREQSFNMKGTGASEVLVRTRVLQMRHCEVH